MRLLVTGASGFIGNAICVEARRRGICARGALHIPRELSVGVERVVVSLLDDHTDWADALREVGVIIHLAARVHLTSDTATDPLAEFRKVNVRGTENLARQAADAGVRRFVMVSTVKVNGESTEPGHPFTALDAPAPQDAYAISKHEAEQGLRAISAQTGMEVVIVRPPLVYGPGVKANFQTMMRWLHRGIPLPLGGVTGNRRSLVALDNLADLLILCLDHPAAANRTFMVSDGEDLSTADLLRRLGQAMNKPARLLPVPPGLLQTGARLLGRGAVAQRLLGSLQVESCLTREVLGWTPPVSVDEGLHRAARAFRP